MLEERSERFLRECSLTEQCNTQRRDPPGSPVTLPNQKTSCTLKRLWQPLRDIELKSDACANHEERLTQSVAGRFDDRLNVLHSTVVRNSRDPSHVRCRADARARHSSRA